MEMIENLRTFLENGEDWERKPTSVPGVSLIRLPATRNRPASLAVEVNPLGPKGLPIKKKGIMIMSSQELDAFQQLLSNQNLSILLCGIEELLPEKKAAQKQGDVLQI